MVKQDEETNVAGRTQGGAQADQRQQPVRAGERNEEAAARHREQEEPAVKKKQPVSKPTKVGVVDSPPATRQKKGKAQGMYPNQLLEEHEEQYHPSKEVNDKDTPTSSGLYPMVAVANPRYGGMTADGQRDERPTILVYRPWTREDRQRALQAVRDIGGGPDDFIEDMENLRIRYNLNGRELMDCMRQALNLRWYRARGAYTGNDALGNVLAHDSPELHQQVDAWYAHLRTAFAIRANYDKIAGCKQKTGETPTDYLARLEPVFRANSGIPYNEEAQGAFQQQLKRALIAGLQEEQKKHVQKHWVQQETGTTSEALTWAEHAFKLSQKQEQSAAAVNTEIFMQAFSGQQRGFNQRGRGRSRGRGRGQYRGGSGKDDNRCYNCGKLGHFSRDCRSKPQFDG